MAVPTAAEANVAVPPVQVTTSAPITPVSVQPLNVAPVVPLYVLLPAVTLAVTVAPVMSAVVVAFVDDSTELPARAPESVRPVAVTVLAAPTADAANVEPPPHVTTAAPITPLSLQLAV